MSLGPGSNMPNSCWRFFPSPLGVQGRSQELTKTGGGKGGLHCVKVRALTRFCDVVFTTCCSLFALERLKKVGDMDTLGPPSYVSTAVILFCNRDNLVLSTGLIM